MTAFKEDVGGTVSLSRVSDDEDNVIEVGGSKSGSLSSSETIDYRFSTETAGTVVFELTKPFGENFSIIDSKGKTVSAVESTSTKSGSNYIYHIKAELDVGSYWFRLGTGSGSYKLTYKEVVKVSDLSVKTMPSRTEYTTGNDELLYDGLVLHVVYSDGAEEDIAYGENSLRTGFSFTLNADFSLQDVGLHYVKAACFSTG